jgi:NTE family protein
LRNTGSKKLPGQVVLVMQGGGALGAFHAGVYEAMHEAGIEPDWVVGTSIGAINAALIAGNPPQERVARLRSFWQKVASAAPSSDWWRSWGWGNWVHNLGAVASGIPGMFTPNVQAHLGAQWPLGVTQASWYRTDALRDTLEQLVDFAQVARRSVRMTLGAVNVATGRMCYFDSRDALLGPAHVLASAALPPAFPAVEIDGQYYWDGGIYSNTPIEAVMDDRPRRDAVIFAAQLWQQQQALPDTLAQVNARMKDIQYASRIDSHLSRQQQIHQLRHVVRALGHLLPSQVRATEQVRELLSWGCGTLMHVLPLQAPALPGEDHTKDLDFTPSGIRVRWEAGLALARRKITQAPWNDAVTDPTLGVVLHR